MLRFAVTADLHFGVRHAAGHQASLEMISALLSDPPDVLVLAGDIGAGQDFERCFERFDGLHCVKLFTPGNHDIWVTSGDTRGDSLQVYADALPAAGRRHGFQCLDFEPWRAPAESLAVVGTMNWYDYSWSLERLREEYPDADDRLRRKHFSRSMHNDANFVRWPHTDESFTREIVERFESQFAGVRADGLNAVVVTHHPPLLDLCYPIAEPPGLDALLWLAFSGNAEMESILRREADSIPYIFCGHTHHGRECKLGAARGVNVGGDYHFKRLVRFDWPGGELRYEEFGQA